MKTVAEWFPKKERGLAAGIFNSGTSIGVVCALLITPWILVNMGWQQVFIITGALGFLWLILWLWLYEIPAKQKYLSREEFLLITEQQEDTPQEETRHTKWVRLFTLPQTWAFIFGKFLIDPIFWFFLFWLPSYFSSTFHLDLTRPSPELMIIYSATTVGSIAGGYFSSRLIKSGMAALKARKDRSVHNCHIGTFYHLRTICNQRLGCSCIDQPGGRIPPGMGNKYIYGGVRYVPETSCELGSRNRWHGWSGRWHFLSDFCGLFTRLL